MLRWLVVFTAFLAFLGVWGSHALAQTSTSTTTTTSSSTGTFDSLSPGNQKIARALFEAQPTESGGTTTPLTLDEIAAKKQGGQGWGNIFKDMKAQGLVQEKNLGQVVSRYQRSTHGGTTTTSGGTFTASGRELSSASRGPRGKAFDAAAGDTRGSSTHTDNGGTMNSGRGHTYTSGSSYSGSGASAAGRSGGGPGQGGRGGR